MSPVSYAGLHQGLHHRYNDCHYCPKNNSFCVNIEKTELNHLNLVSLITAQGLSGFTPPPPTTPRGKAWSSFSKLRNVNGWSRLKLASTNLSKCTWLATTDNKVLWWHYMSHRWYPSDWQEQSPLESSRSLRGKKEDTLVVACSHITEETFYPSFFVLLLFFFSFFLFFIYIYERGIFILFSYENKQLLIILDIYTACWNPVLPWMPKNRSKVMYPVQTWRGLPHFGQTPGRCWR